MASNMFSTQCPHCGRSAIEDNYYKTDETTIVCYRCGYYYSRKIKTWTDTTLEHEEDEHLGYGVILLNKKEGSGKRVLLNRALTSDEIEAYYADFFKDDVDQENSYFILYQDGVFTIKFGIPTENFHLPFEEYKVKMIEKYGEDEYDFMVPIEE